MKRLFFINMQKIIRALIITVLLLASTQVAFAALTVTTTGGKYGYGIYQTGDGGEFTLQQGGDLNVAGNYSANANYGIGTTNTFQTFCLEKNESISHNATYTAVLNNAAVNGGVNHPSTHSDPISQGTAWLYFAFAQGTLTGYNYTGSNHNHNRKDSAAALQNTIWFLEDELTTLDNKTFLNLALVALKTDVTGAKADYTGSAVQVLNLTDASGNRHQDQLVVAHTPIPAAAWLFGSGLMGLIGIRRRVAS